MIKIILEIKENDKYETSDIIATEVKVGIEEIRVKATKEEIKTSKIINERLNFKKEEVINTSSKDFNKLIEILSSI